MLLLLLHRLLLLLRTHVRLAAVDGSYRISGHQILLLLLLLELMLLLHLLVLGVLLVLMLRMLRVLRML